MSIDLIIQESSPTPIQRVPKWQSVFRHFLFYIVLAVIGASFAGGYFLGKGQETLAPTRESGEVRNNKQKPPEFLGKDVDFNLFWDVWQRVKDGYIQKDLSDTKLFYGALSGMVSAVGDPYTAFLDPEFAKKFDESLSGSFDGIGAEIGMKKGQLIIIAPLSDTPAERAGLRASDKIISIDKKDTNGMAIDYAVSIIRGKKGTPVVLTIFRDGEEKTRDIKIVRDTIEVKSVTFKMLPNSSFGYIKISHFNEDTETLFRQAVRELLGKRMTGLVLDVRNNPGGFLDTAIQIAGNWVDGKTVVIEQYEGNKKEEYKARTRPLLATFPTVVLVNEGSASASEIVAGALQDYGKGKLIGTKTFGKGSVQDLQRLKDGSSLKITIAHWLTPKGRLINEIGIEPDIKVEIKDEEREANRDPQLDRAIQELGAKK